MEKLSFFGPITFFGRSKNKSLILSLFLSHTHKNTHAHLLTHTHTHTCTHTHILTLSIQRIFFVKKISFISLEILERKSLSVLAEIFSSERLIVTRMSTQKSRGYFTRIDINFFDFNYNVLIEKLGLCTFAYKSLA